MTFNIIKMNRGKDFQVKNALTLLFILIIAGYSLFEARGIISGPSLEVHEPKNGSGFKQSLMTVSGTAKKIVFLSINDHPTSTDEKGGFEERVLLAPGYNTLKVKVEDRLGREKIKIYELVYNLENNTTLIHE